MEWSWQEGLAQSLLPARLYLRHRNIMRGDVDTGEHTFRHYCRIYAVVLPAALDGQPLDAPVKPNGLVNRVIRAAARKRQAYSEE